MKETESTPQPADEQLRLQSAAVQAAANTIVITDRAGKIIWVNPAFTQHTGYSLAEALGQNPRLLKSGKQDAAFYQGMWETILAGKVWHDTIVNRRKDGTLSRDDLTITPITDATGAITHFVGIKQDITEQTRAQEGLQASELRYRRLFESAKDGILILDAISGKIIDVNPFLIEMLSYSREDFLGKELWQLGFFRDVLESKAAFVELQKQGYIRYEDLPLKTRDGTVKQVEFVSNTYLVGGSPVIQCNIRDITASKGAQKTLKQTNQRLERALTELQAKRDELTGMTAQLWQASKLATMGELAASVAHELNNPLATISLRLDSLATQLARDGQESRDMEIVVNEVERMGKLVGGLLQFGHRSHQQISTIDICEEIEKTLELTEYYFRSHKIEVVRQFDAALPTVPADREQLRQVFLNLMTNASDAMPQGGKLIVRVQAQADDGTKSVRVELADSGSGIAPADREKLWEPFFTTKPEGKGTGLGLAICRRVVEAHRGSIAIDSRLGEGTTVRIILPATNGSSKTNCESGPLLS